MLRRRHSVSPSFAGFRFPSDEILLAFRWYLRSGLSYRDIAESINRHLDDTLWLRRAHSVGARRQLLDPITYAIGVNAMSMHLHRQGIAPPLAA